MLQQQRYVLAETLWFRKAEICTVSGPSQKALTDLCCGPFVVIFQK